MTKFQSLKLLLLAIVTLGLIGYVLFLLQIISLNMGALDGAYVALQACIRLISIEGTVANESLLGYVINSQTIIIAICILLLGKVAWAVAKFGNSILNTSRLVAQLEIVKEHNGVKFFRADFAAIFTSGVVMPEVYISHSYARNLTKPELDAAILHEKAHAQSFDPLLSGYFEMFMFALPPFPGKRQIKQIFGVLTELNADLAAVDAQGTKEHLLSSIYKATKYLSQNYLALNSLTGSINRIELLTSNRAFPTAKIYKLVLASLVTFLAGGYLLTNVTLAAMPSSVICKGASNNEYMSFEVLISRE